MEYIQTNNVRKTYDYLMRKREQPYSATLIQQPSLQ